MLIYSVLSFLNPTILWGLFAVSIPIIIHLFNLRRVKRVEFSNIALLRRVKEETSAKKKPVEILILISRILFLTFLVFAFAQPISKDEDNSLELSDEVLIYLDNSLSMQMPVGSQSNAFDLAYSFANSVVDAYPDNTKFKLIENGYSNSIVVNYSKSTIKDRLTELNIVSVDRNPAEIFTRIANTNFRGDVYLISDFQKNSPTDLNLYQADTSRNYYMVPIQPDGFSNVFFDSAYLENTFLLGALKNELKVSVRNEGPNAVEGVNMRLFLDNQLTSTALLDLDANGVAQHSFELDRSASGLNRVKVTLEDPEVDFDNEFYLTLNNIEKINISEIRSGSSNRFVNQLYSGNELFNFNSFDVGNLDLNQLNEADIIVLNELSAFSNQLISAIRGFLENGGSVIVIPSSNSSAADYGDLGLTLVPGSQQRLVLSSPKLENPFFDGVFEEQDESIAMPEATLEFRLLNEEYSILEFRNGRSFLSKASAPGNLYFYASPFATNSTSFTNHSLFVPVMYKLALGARASLTRLYYATDDETVVQPLGEEGLNEIVNINNGDKVLTPDQRVSGNNLILEIPKDEVTAGHFDIRTGGGTIGTVAFNIPKSESLTERFTEEELEQMASADHIYTIDAETSVDVDRELTAGVKGIGLWRYALMLALFFLFAEIILIRYL